MIGILRVLFSDASHNRALTGAQETSHHHQLVTAPERREHEVVRGFSPSSRNDIATGRNRSGTSGRRDRIAATS